jgi:hypothetical protein
MSFVANVTIKWFALPKATCSPKHFVTLVCGKTLPGVHDCAHFVSALRCKERVDMIGHHTPRMQRVAIAIEMQQRILDDFGDSFVT